MTGKILGAVGVLVVGVAAVALLSPAPTSAPSTTAAETQALLDRIAKLEQRVVALEDRPVAAATPASARPAADRLTATDAAPPLPAGEADPLAARPDTAAGTATGAPAGGDSTAAVTAKVLGAVDERVDQAVEKKMDELKRKQNKKPSLATVVELLELDESQRQLVEQESRKGQRQIRNVLEVPTANGTSLLDELVDVMAHGQAKRPETGKLWGEWIKRLTTEKVPGTDQTYAAQIEQAKSVVREGFQRVMSEEQYKEFQEWAFDPTEIQEIKDSPWGDLEQRVAERTKALLKR